ncbi:Similar to Tailor: Terminal uridylyltransferase Tailor (Drosophila melanogaster) [Cotesia congregata]|uniref:Similar to Tailor: Terminal uridylyltransferase Tailor (Drosophila melanogaster) n=1 Tax=Cotesia congregata TaxID=51543 RepID=A0A8J2HG57_COTCN|nr:Similar to Tailor: Terminal uridylyltransferase Tailor (Drosophila melanogaster) [Cotesia congregata]
MPSRKRKNHKKKICGILDDEDKLTTCFICFVQEKWQDHKEKPEHKSKLQFFENSFKEISEENVRCKICKSLVSKLAFQKHASKKHKLIPWYRPENEFTTFFKNNITNIGNEYHCHLCEKTYYYWYESIKHTGETYHSKSLKEFTRLNDLNTIELTEKISQQFVTNGIILLSHTQLKCWTCDCIIVGHENADKHIISEIHKNNLLKKKELMSGTCNTVSSTVNVAEDYPTYFENFIIKRHNDYFCNLCNKNYLLLCSVMNHIEDLKHKELLSRKRLSLSIGSAPCKPNICEVLVKNNIFQSNSQQLECYSCSFIISSYRTLEEHINSKNHKITLGFVSATNISLSLQINDTVLINENDDTIKQIVQSPEWKEDFSKDLDNFIRKNQDGYYCYLCNIQFSTSSEMMMHLNHQEHIDLMAVNEISQVIVNPASPNCYSENHVMCKLCNTNIPKNSVVDHAMNDHQSLPCFQPDNEFIIYFKNFITPKNDYYCYICNKSNKRWYLALEHVKHFKHSECIKMFINDSDINEAALSLEQCEKYANNSIFPFTFTQLRCWKCNYIIDGYENAEKHISSDEHEKILKNISANEVPEEIVINDSHVILQKPDFNNSTDNDDKSSICKIKTNNSTDQFNLSNSLEKSIDVNESKVAKSSGYASANTESAINNKSSDINTDLLSSTLQDLSINKISDKIISNENQDHVNAAIAIKQYNCVPDKKSLPELEDIYVKYFENCIFTWSNRYYCSLCRVCLFTEKMTSEHMKEPFHENQLDLRKYISSGEGLPYLPNSYEKLVRNNIFYKNSSSLFCFSCQCDLGKYKNAEDHIKDKNHLSSFTNAFNFTDGSSTENVDGLMQPTLSSLPESKDHFVMYFNNFIEKCRDSYGCHLCQIQFTYLFDVGAHINSINHLKLVNRTKKAARPIECGLDFYELCVRNGVFQKYTDSLECIRCGYSIGINQVEAHVGNKKHKHKLSSSTLTFKTLSQSEITANNNSIFDTKISELSSEDTSNDEVKNDLEELYLKCFENYILVRYHDYFCNLCETDLSTPSSVLSHIHDSDHQNLWMEERKNQDAVENKVLFIPNLIEILVRNNIFLIHNSTFKCVSCDCIISGYICAEQHVNGYQHKANHATVLEKKDESISDLLLNSREDFATYLINFIEKRRTDYYCHLCCVDLSPSAVMTHVEDNNHHGLVKYKKLTSAFKSQYYLYLLEMCVRNSLFQVYYIELKCFKCQVFFKLTSSNIEEHVHSDEHETKSKDDSTEKSAVSTIANQIIGNDLYPRLFNFSNQPSPSEVNDLISKCYNNYIYYRADDYFCNLCNLTLSSLQITAHLEYPDHQILLRQKKIGKQIMPMPVYMSNILEVFIRNNIFQIDSNSLYCFTCDCPVYLYEEHIDTEEHKDNLKSFTLKVFESTSISDNIRLNESENDYKQYFEHFIFKDRSDYFCYACLKSFKTSLLVNIHINEETHKSNVIEKKRDMNIMIDIPQMSNVYQKLVRNNIVAHESQNMKCYSCHYVLPSITDVELHIENKFHQQKHGPVIIEPSGKQDTLWTDQSISDSSKVLNISQTNTKPLISLRASAVELKESKITSRNVLTRDVFYYNDAKKSVVYCIVCSQKLESRVYLHIHLTSHFWQLFTNKNTRDLMELTNINSGVKMIVNNEESFVGPVLYDPMLQKRKTLLKYQSKLPNNDSSNKNAAVPQQLYVNAKDNEICNDEIGKGGLKDDNDLSLIDIDEDETPKKIDIYAIDQELQYINQLSLNRICVINEDKIYCMICRKSIAYSVRIVYEHFRSIEHSFFLTQMIQDHIKFQGVPDELSDLSLAREFMEDKNYRHVVCHVCDSTNPRFIPNTDEALKNHINQYKHLKSKCKLNSDLQQFKTDFHARLERSWSNTQRYWCVICSEQFKYEKTFYKHLSSKHHHKGCDKYMEYENFVCDFCPPCGLLFYGFKNTLTYHSDCQFHQYYADRPFYSITRLPTAVEDLLANTEKMMNSKIEELDLVNILMEHEEKSLIDDLKYTINNFIKAEIYPFGSRASGLGLASSDLDLFVDCDNLYYKGTIETDKSELLKEVEHALKQNEDIWTIKRTVLDCRIPIITITHQLTSIDSDLSFINGLSVESSKLVKSYIDKFPLCRQLILFVKDWINISNLGGEDGICNYAIVWMMIYYLQTKFILPNVAALIKAKGKSQLIGGWETGASTDFSIADCDYNFKDLLKGFFIMCAGFDYKNNIICPLLGRPVRKLDIVKPAKLTNLPDEMKLYKTFVTKNKKAQRFSLDSVMAVQDPYDLSNNLTKAVKKSTMYRFKTYCSLSGGKLAN